jgi:hypothetical protein
VTINSDFLIRMRISSQILEIDLALYFGKIGKPHRENFHFSWERVPFTIPCGSGSLKLDTYHAV